MYFTHLTFYTSFKNMYIFVFSLGTISLYRFWGRRDRFNQTEMQLQAREVQRERRYSRRSAAERKPAKTWTLNCGEIREEIRLFERVTRATPPGQFSGGNFARHLEREYVNLGDGDGSDVVNVSRDTHHIRQTLDDEFIKFERMQHS